MDDQSEGMASNANGFEPLDRIAEKRLPLMPITMMFAADQIGAKYHDYVTDYRVLAEAQAVTANRFELDYVSVVSDPGREAADCGATVMFFEDQPPAIDEHEVLLAEPKDLNDLKFPDPLGGGRMHDRIKGVGLLREKVGPEKIVEGWIEGPCAEGADLRGIHNIMLDFYDHPEFVHDLFAFIVEMEVAFARAQVEAGANLIAMGDAAASLVGPEFYRAFVWPYEKQIVERVQSMGAAVRLHICGNTKPLLGAMGELGCQIVDLDSMAPLDAARAAMGDGQVLLGNIDPVQVLRNGTPEGVYEAVEACHQQAGGLGGRFVVGAGCEVPRDTPVENFRVMRDYAFDHR